MSRPLPLLVALVLLLGLGVPASLWADDASGPRKVNAVVVPERPTLLTASATGVVLRVLVELGDRVEVGQLLLQIDPREADLVVQGATSDLAVQAAAVDVQARRVCAARDALKPAEGVLKSMQKRMVAGQARADELVRARVAADHARADLEIAELELKRENALLQRREVALNLARLTLERTGVRAPVAGLVEEVLARAGETVRAAESGILVLREPERLLVVFEAPRLRALAVGTSVGIILRLEDTPFEGRIVKVEPLPSDKEEGATSMKVHVRPERSAMDALRPGQRVVVIVPEA